LTLSLPPVPPISFSMSFRLIIDQSKLRKDRHNESIAFSDSGQQEIGRQSHKVIRDLLTTLPNFEIPLSSELSLSFSAVASSESRRYVTVDSLRTDNFSPASQKSPTTARCLCRSNRQSSIHGPPLLALLRSTRLRPFNRSRSSRSSPGNNSVALRRNAFLYRHLPLRTRPLLSRTQE